MVQVEHHPHFASQYEPLCADPDSYEVAGEVTALLDALERYGHDIEGEDPDDPSHPIVIADLDIYALRRTPPTKYTPYADRPPVLRIAYVWFRDLETATELAVVMSMGDKSTLGAQWYPAQKQLIESKLAPEWQRAHPTHQPIGRRHP